MELILNNTNLIFKVKEGTDLSLKHLNYTTCFSTDGGNTARAYGIPASSPNYDITLYITDVSQYEGKKIKIFSDKIDTDSHSICFLSDLGGLGTYDNLVAPAYSTYANPNPTAVQVSEKTAEVMLVTVPEGANYLSFVANTAESPVYAKVFI